MLLLTSSAHQFVYYILSFCMDVDAQADVWQMPSKPVAVVVAVSAVVALGVDVDSALE